MPRVGERRRRVQNDEPRRAAAGWCGRVPSSHPVSPATIDGTTAITATSANADGQLTRLRLHCHVHGVLRPLGRYQAPASIKSVTVTFLGGSPTDGAHTVDILVADQVGAVSTYRATGVDLG